MLLLDTAGLQQRLDLGHFLIDWWLSACRLGRALLGRQGVGCRPGAHVLALSHGGPTGDHSAYHPQNDAEAEQAQAKPDRWREDDLGSPRTEGNDGVPEQSEKSAEVQRNGSKCQANALDGPALVPSSPGQSGRDHAKQRESNAQGQQYGVNSRHSPNVPRSARTGDGGEHPAAPDNSD